VKLLDVNVLVAAFRPDVANHDAAAAAIAASVASRDGIVILTEVAVGFLRVVTRSGVFADPNTPEEGMTALHAWSMAPTVAVREAGAGRWRIFQQLMASHDFRGNDVHDGLLAAAALDVGASLVTSDKGFGRFEDLRVEWI
jgi:uncharacterized protein